MITESRVRGVGDDFGWAAYNAFLWRVQFVKISAKDVTAILLATLRILQASIRKLEAEHSISHHTWLQRVAEFPKSPWECLLHGRSKTGGIQVPFVPFVFWNMLEISSLSCLGNALMCAGARCGERVRVCRTRARFEGQQSPAPGDGSGPRCPGHGPCSVLLPSTCWKLCCLQSCLSRRDNGTELAGQQGEAVLQCPADTISVVPFPSSPVHVFLGIIDTCKLTGHSFKSFSIE